MEYEFRTTGWIDGVHKALVTLAIEQTLADIGKPVLEQVSHRLFHEYHCYIPDCYENPEYLSIVLKEIFGSSYASVIDSIRDHLKDSITQQSSVERFLEAITK